MTRVVLALAVGAVVLLALVALGAAAGSADVQVYQHIGDLVLVRGPELTSEYPPAASALFGMLVRLAHGSFSTAWVATIAGAALLASACAGLAVSAERAAAILLAFLAMVGLLGLEMVFCRYDALIGLLLLLAWMAHREDRPACAGALVALAGALKLVPLALLPVLFLRSAPGTRRRLLAGAALGGVLSLLAALAILGIHGVASNLAYLVRYHAGRGVQVESTWSGLAMLARAFHGGRSPIVWSHGCHENADLGPAMPTLCRLTALAGLIGLWCAAWAARAQGRGRADDLEDDAPLLVAVLAWLLASSTVLSTQYFTWIVPLLLVWTAGEIRRGAPGARRGAIAILATTCGLGALTHWLSPAHYFELLDQRRPLLTVLLNVRNGLVLLLGALCLHRWLRGRRLAWRIAGSWVRP